MKDISEVEPTFLKPIYNYKVKSMHKQFDY